MYHNYISPTATTALPELLKDLLRGGEEVGSRGGRVKELTHVGITLTHPWRREILVDSRKPSIAAQIAETMWILAGRDDIEWLANYLPRVYDFSDDGERWRAGYGRRLRSWPRRQGHETTPIDQLAYVVRTLRESPLSRQAVATIWDPQIDTAPGKDIPCNNWLSFSSRLGKLDLHVAIRSNDAIWGWSGINAFEWSTLQEVVAGLLGLQVGSLHFSTTSFHLYDHHWTKAHKIVEAWQHGPVPAPVADSPRFDASVFGRDLESFDDLMSHWFQLEYDIRTGSPLVDGYVERFPEPMLRGWLRVLQWWWGKGDTSYLAELKGTALEAATRYSVQPKHPTVDRLDSYTQEQHTAGIKEARRQAEDRREDRTERAREAAERLREPVNTCSPEPSDFISSAIRTHNEKHAAYGDSWKRRGEMLGIMANVARKVDRLGQGETSDETSADTAMDLMVYLAKYLVWLEMHTHGVPHDFDASDFPDEANSILLKVEREVATFRPLISSEARFTEEWLTKTFDRLEDAVTRQDKLRHEIVSEMLVESYRLARTLWEAENPVDEYRGADVD